jgi:hypothetical protein
MRHPATSTWQFPAPGGDDLERVNLRELAARPDRFEHHLIVVAQIGGVQLEIATASEPLYFAHINISDEYAVALPTGDPLLDAFPMRTFVAPRDGTGELARYNHRAGDLVLHPVGHPHWPGKLRPPYEGLAIPPGMRRAGVSLVYCAAVPMASNARPAALDPKRAGDVKVYALPTTVAHEVAPLPGTDARESARSPGSDVHEPARPPGSDAREDARRPSSRPAGDARPPTFSLADLLRGPAGIVASVGPTTLELVIDPSAIAPPHGGWAVVITGERPCELVRIPPGQSLAGAGISRALVFAGDAAPDPVPPSWRAFPLPPFAPFEDALPGQLPFEHGELRVEAAGPTATVRISDSTAEVPRYWLARMLFRIALHDFRLGYVETYGGFYADDTTDLRLGIRGGASIAIPRSEALAVIERLYRGVAPAGYVERIH